MQETLWSEKYPAKIRATTEHLEQTLAWVLRLSCEVFSAGNSRGVLERARKYMVKDLGLQRLYWEVRIIQHVDVHPDHVDTRG